MYAEQLINSINEQANNPELINAWTGLLSVDTDYALGEADEKIREYLSQIASLLDIDVTQLTSLLGYDERLDLKNKLKDKYVGQKTGVKSYTTENGEQRYYQSNTDGYQTYLDFIDSLENPDEAQLILDASIDEDSMNWTTEQWRDFLNELKKDASIKIETKLDPVKPLSEMKSAFSDFESIYNDIHNNSFVASDAIEKLNEAFGDLTLADGTNALQEFKDILTTMPDDVEAQQKALEKLGTLYLDNSDLLKNLNEENKEYTIRQLEAIGVTNAREVVESRLNQTEEDLSKSQNILNIVYIADEVNKLLEPPKDEWKHNDKGYWYEYVNITLRRSRLSGVARATIPDKQSHLVTNYCTMF